MSSTTTPEPDPAEWFPLPVREALERAASVGVKRGSYMVTYAQLDHPDEKIDTPFWATSIFVAELYAARACPDGFFLRRVVAL